VGLGERPVSNPDAASVEIRKIAARIGKEVPIRVQTYDKLFKRVLQQDRMVALLSGFFGVLGMTLAFVGLHGVMAYAVNARTGEIGIRMALGAQSGTVTWMILKDSLTLASWGAIIGVPVALVASRFIASCLFGVTPSDPLRSRPRRPYDPDTRNAGRLPPRPSRVFAGSHDRSPKRIESSWVNVAACNEVLSR
jgi:ABC-type antimicrobial peptide transport system permease subunit